jgi:hypothetical protein
MLYRAIEDRLEKPSDEVGSECAIAESNAEHCGAIVLGYRATKSIGMCNPIQRCEAIAVRLRARPSDEAGSRRYRI